MMTGQDKTSFSTIVVTLLLIWLAVGSRLAPHPANFAPIGAIAIFGGALLPRRLALSIPLASMIVSDLLLGLHPLIGFTWGSFALIAVLANISLRKITTERVVLLSVSASVIFFTVSNFGVWLEGLLYERTLTGLISCFYNALPFFRNTLMSDLLYSGLLFAAYGAWVSLGPTVIRKTKHAVNG